MEWRRSDEACRRISDVPVVGLLTATAAVAVIGNARTFKSGREFAAYLGLVPRQNGSGGKVKLGGISKRGDVSISAARARRADPTGEGGHFDRWLKRLSRRDAVEMRRSFTTFRSDCDCGLRSDATLYLNSRCLFDAQTLLDTVVKQSAEGQTFLCSTALHAQVLDGWSNYKFVQCKNSVKVYLYWKAELAGGKM